MPPRVGDGSLAADGAAAPGSGAAGRADGVDSPTSAAPEQFQPQSGPTRTFDELREAGLLWLINRQVFHPRGFAMSLEYGKAGDAVGWKLHGDGVERFLYGADVPEEDLMRRANEALSPRSQAAADPTPPARREPARAMWEARRDLVAWLMDHVADLDQADALEKAFRCLGDVDAGRFA